MDNDMKSPYERALAVGDREFRELADFAPAMIWRVGADGSCDWVNRPWLDYTGRDLAAEVDTGWTDGIHPDDLERCLATFGGSFQAREPFEMEYRLRRHDGTYRWLMDHGRPFSRDGRFAGYWGSCVDVTVHREAQRAQRVLVNELNHRVKNTLAVVQAMASQSFREGRPVAESLASFEGRLQALAGAQDLLVEQAWDDVPLRRLVESTVAPHDPGSDRITLQGPALMLSQASAVSVTMAVHELLTNAAKYGALSAPEGRIALAWSFDAASDRLRLSWKESGGPAVCPPTRRGFGVRFIERVLASQAGGEAAIAFEPDGVRCHVELPARPAGQPRTERPAADLRP